MKSKRLETLMQYLHHNMLSYEEVMNLNENQCVKVNRTYFHYLIAKAGILQIKVEDYYNVFYKYLEIDNMQNFINGFNKTTSYYLMSATDIKYLISLMKDIPSSKTAFLKSNVSVQKLNENHDKIRRCFLEKKENIIKKDNEINYDDENLEDLSRHIEERKNGDKDGKVCRMLENPGVPCDIKTTEESAKILAKILLK